MFSPITYKPGTDKTPQETETSSLAFTDTDKVHFPDGRLRTIDPWNEVTPVDMDIYGAARTIYGHIRSDGVYYLFGTSTRLYAVKNGTWYNMTPLADQKCDSLGSDPLAVTNSDATLTITYTSHGLSVGDHVTLTGATNLGGVDADTYINGVDFHVDTVPDADTITVEMGTTASSTDGSGGGDNITIRSLGATDELANPLDTTNGSAVITVNYTSHGLSDGDRIELSDASTIGGIPDTEINAQHIITYVDANSFTITVSTSASSDVTGGGGANIHIFTPITAGNIDVSLGYGYGMGLYGVGLYGVGKVSTAGSLSYPRIWSIDSFGDSMIVCPGDYSAGDGQKIYIWDGDTDTAPIVVCDAPTDCNYAFVFNNAVVALCGNRVDISQAGNATSWTPGVATNAYTVDIERVRRFIGGSRVGDVAIIYSENEALLLEWINEPDYYQITDLFDSDGLIAPNAFVEVEGECFWQGKRGWYRFNQARVARIPNPQNEDWVLENINTGQQWKCFAAHDSKYDQVYFYFPTSNDEPDTYDILNLSAGHWTLGSQSRTALARNGFVNSQYYGIYGDSTSQPADVYLHFLTENANLALAPYAETSFGMIGNGDRHFRINRIMPDTYQAGDITVKIITKEYPNSATEYSATYTLAATDEYVNTRTSGRIRKYRIEQSATGAYFTMGDWKEDIVGQGRR